jgi:hypothetical protein
LAKRLKAVPTPLHLEAGPIWWYDFLNKEMFVMTRAELVELGAILDLGINIMFRQKNLLNKVLVILANYIRWIM